MESLRQINLDTIVTDWAGPVRYDQKSLDRLEHSIKSCGIKTPVWVWEQESGRYWLISGQHRCECARRIGIESVPAIIKQISKKTEAFALAAVENQGRRSADVYDKLIACYRYIQSALEESSEQLTFKEIQSEIFSLQWAAKKYGKNVESTASSKFVWLKIFEANNQLNIWKFSTLARHSSIFSYPDILQEALQERTIPGVNCAAKIQRVAKLSENLNAVMDDLVNHIKEQKLNPKKINELLDARESEFSADFEKDNFEKNFSELKAKIDKIMSEIKEKGAIKKVHDLSKCLAKF